jgi:hypothetical protein
MDHPGEVLRWLRRVCVAMALFLFLISARIWATDDSAPWVLLGCAGVLLLNALTLGPAIRRADSEGVITDADELQRRRRRGWRGAWLVSVGIALGLVAVGYVVAGVGGAVIFLGFAIVIVGPGLWMSRRWLGNAPR